MQFRKIEIGPGFDRYGQHIIVRPGLHSVHPVSSVAVPEGGSTLLFVLVALTAIGWAVSKRFAANRMSARLNS